jgi:hypothetical protein
MSTATRTTTNLQEEIKRLSERVEALPFTLTPGSIRNLKEEIRRLRERVEALPPTAGNRTLEAEPKSQMPQEMARVETTAACTLKRDIEDWQREFEYLRKEFEAGRLGEAECRTKQRMVLRCIESTRNQLISELRTSGASPSKAEMDRRDSPAVRVEVLTSYADPSMRKKGKSKRRHRKPKQGKMGLSKRRHRKRKHGRWERAWRYAVPGRARPVQGGLPGSGKH